MKKGGFCSIWSNWISTTVSSLCHFRTCSFRAPLLFDKLAAKPPAPQGYRPGTRSRTWASAKWLACIYNNNRIQLPHNKRDHSQQLEYFVGLGLTLNHSMIHDPLNDAWTLGTQAAVGFRRYRWNINIPHAVPVNCEFMPKLVPGIWTQIAQVVAK